MHVELKPTPNVGAFRDPRTIDTIILHNTDGSAAGTISWFAHEKSKVSAHYLISRLGRVFQFVLLNRTAWHAKAWNTRSVGIELESYEIRWGMTREQETTLLLLIEEIRKSCPIKYVKIHRQCKGNVTECPKWLWKTDKEFEDWKVFHKLEDWNNE